MEINRFDRVLGVQTLVDITEGRLVLLTANTNSSFDFGSNTDLPGAKVPATAEEAKNARFVLTWAVDNRQPPYYNPTPSYAWSLRKGGYDQAENVPFDTEVWMTYPGYRNDFVIPSGTKALAFEEGTYTFTNVDYIASNLLHVAGALVQVANTAEDGASAAGKLKICASYGDRKVGEVEMYDSATGNLTVRLDH